MSIAAPRSEEDRQCAAAFDAGWCAAIEHASEIAEKMQYEWQRRSHQDGETRLVAEMLGKCAAAIREP